MALFRKKPPIHVPPGERLPLRDNSDDSYVIYPRSAFVSDAFPRGGDGIDFVDGKVRPVLCERDEIPGDAMQIARDLLSFHDRQHTPLNVGYATKLFADFLTQNISHFYPEQANAVREWRAGNGVRFGPLRDVFGRLPRGLDILDFEIIRAIAIMADEEQSPILGFPPDESQPTEPEEIWGT